ncbi:2-dehydropantoate 2-reductase N-terminal domain-containing protein [Microbacterium sp. Se63.02b]|uniref:2-dehydropantoate 2-reductase N-terminal domain-containing protein n=1 Tax=Microbacterium sp. Se63.02b TaxID=2709304 RepID=UPI001FCE3FCA|nr:2-dehydropantoate 2-reductase N-terminal domain-containing protein [Microbacterium sp. Se63.02b]
MTDRETPFAPVDAAAPEIAVIGPGAIGTTIAAALHEAGRTPLLYGRTPRPELELLAGDDRITVPGPVRTDPDQVSHPADVVFLAVKATQIDGAAPWMAALCGPDTVVCVLQNGVEQTAMVSPMCGGRRRSSRPWSGSLHRRTPTDRCACAGGETHPARGP